jgi:hypothetical protein
MTIDKENYFDAARGLHWYCVDNHSGMSSELYAIQCELKYTPSPSENGASDDDYSGYVYECLENGIMQPDEILEAIQEVMAEND